MAKITITLEGDCAKQIVRSIARSYAMLSIYSRLTEATGTVNAPWFNIRHRKRCSLLAAHREWITKIDRERVSYRRALESILGDVPDVPAIEWRPYTSPDGKTYPVYFNVTRAGEAVTAYADFVMGMVAL